MPSKLPGQKRSEINDPRGSALGQAYATVAPTRQRLRGSRYVWGGLILTVPVLWAVALPF